LTPAQATEGCVVPVTLQKDIPLSWPFRGF
jgi:hypothetical protein